ncbi:MAG: SMP-30/gluconolactonase/LRE family protein [Alphaproteobacteria bacterium]
MTETTIAVACQNQLGECPLWHEQEQALYWTDIQGKTLWRYHPDSGETRSWTTPDRVGSFAFCADGRFLLALPDRLVRWDKETGSATDVVSAMPGQAAGTRLNDGRCDRQGRFVVGGFDETTRQPIAGLWRLELDGSVTHLIADGIVTANALCFSPDGATMYFADTAAGTIWAFGYDPAPGTPLGNRRVLTDSLEPPGKPDGSVVDADGFIWNAQVLGSRVVRYAPDGRVDRTIDLPVKNPTCPCFGGPGLDTLYVTSLRRTGLADWQPSEIDGSIVALKPGAKGLPEVTFGG